jgi:hypothetical protein
MLLDELMPHFDATRIEHRVVEGAGEAVYEAIRRADFMRTWREKRAARALMGMRVEIERLAARARGTDFHEAEEPESMRLADLPSQGEWVLLGQDPPHEIVFGVVGRFWAGETTWRESEAQELPGFAEPGWAKILCNFSLRPYGERRTLVSYEARTKATDPESRTAFLRYWRLVSPMAGVVLRAQLSEVAEEAARAASEPSRVTE